MTTLTESSPLHVDCYTLTGSDVTNHVAIVVLNTNPEAHFVQGNLTVPIVEESLVHFDGNIPHNIIVNSGSVQFLGPFDAKNLAGVMAVLHCSGVRAEGYVIDPDLLDELKANLKANQLEDGKVQGKFVINSGGGKVFHAIIDRINIFTADGVKYDIASGTSVNLFDDQGALNVVAAVKVDAADIASFGYNKTDITCDNFDLGDIMWLSPATGRQNRPLTVFFVG